MYKLGVGEYARKRLRHVTADAVQVCVDSLDGLLRGFAARQYGIAVGTELLGRSGRKSGKLCRHELKAPAHRFGLRDDGVLIVRGHGHKLIHNRRRGDVSRRYHHRLPYRLPCRLPHAAVATSRRAPFNHAVGLQPYALIVVGGTCYNRARAASHRKFDHPLSVQRAPRAVARCRAAPNRTPTPTTDDPHCTPTQAVGTANEVF